MTFIPGSRWRDGIRKRAELSLQTFLTRLIWLSMLPLLLLGAWLAVDSVRVWHDDFDQEAGYLAQHFASDVDRTLKARIDTLQVLSMSPHVDGVSRWKDLYREGLAFHQRYGSHVILADIGTPMRMLFNTRMPFGAPLPPLPRPMGLAAAAVATGKPAVGDRFIGPIAQEPMIAIAVPVLRQGHARFLLMSAIETRLFHGLLDEAALMPGWSITLLDSRGEVIARRAPSGLKPQADADAGMSVVVKTAAAPWSVVLEIPRAAYRAPLVTAATGLALALLAATLVGFLGGKLAGRRLARSVAALTTTPGPDARLRGISEIDAAAAQRAADSNKLRESEATYRSLFDNMLNGVAYCRMLFENGEPRDFIYLDVNAAFENLTGLREVAGRKVSEVIPGIREHDSNLFAIYGRVAMTGQPERFEIYLKSLRKWFWVSVFSPKPEHFVAVFDVITERKRAEEALRRSEAQLHALAARLQTVREEERGRLARRVHDVLGQQLTGMTLDLAWLRTQLSKVNDADLQRMLADKLAETSDLAETMIQTAQEISSELRPSVLDTLGLCAAMRFEAGRFQKRAGIACAVEVPEEIAPLEAGRATAIFRIFQEILTNVARHAGATRVNIRFRATDAGLVLEIHDNGRGMTPEQLAAAESLGLLGMRERAAQFGGRIEFLCEPGQGTTVTVTVPA